MKSKLAQKLLPLFGTLIFLFLILPMFLFWLPFLLLSFSGEVYFFQVGLPRHLGLLPIVLGIVVYLCCSYNFVTFVKGTPIHFTPTENLIIIGLYRYVRNPMYLGALLILFGEALLYQSKLLIIYTLVSLCALNYYLHFFEEPHLKRRFGESYKRYLKSVHRWVPRLSPYLG